MKAIIYTAEPNAKRIKIRITFQRKDFRNGIKEMNSSWWHPAQKLWSVVNTEKNLKQLKIIFGKDYIIEKGFVRRPVKKRELNKEAGGAVFELEKVLTLKGKKKGFIR